MANLINCKECGALFIKKNSDLCDKCIAHQNELIEKIIKYVFVSTEPVTVDFLLEKFDISLKTFESLFVARKFLKIADKLLLTCNVCHKNFLATGRNNFICADCAKKMQSDCDAHIVSNSDFI